MQHKRLLILLLIYIALTLDSQFAPLPKFYVELTHSNHNSYCSGTLLDATTVLSANHCGNPRFIKTFDGNYLPVVKLYGHAKDDIAFWQIQGDGLILQQYPEIGVRLPFFPTTVHSHVNNIKERIYFWELGEWFLHDLDNAAEIETTVAVQLPIFIQARPGHSGSALLQSNSIITGMLLASDRQDQETKQFLTYSIDGLTIYRHWLTYHEIVEESNLRIHSYGPYGPYGP